MHVGGARGGTRARAWALGSISGWLALLATQGVLEEEVRLKVKVCRRRLMDKAGEKRERVR